jgi:hypothetical protein
MQHISMHYEEEASVIFVITMKENCLEPKKVILTHAKIFSTVKFSLCLTN